MSAINLFQSCRKIVCVGRNYLDHVAELKNAVPKKPLLFLKPSSSLLKEGNAIKIPPMCEDLHHEVELGLVIGVGGSKITEENAMDHVAGYVLALDMTCRDLQEEAKSKGHPWLLAKGWDTFCPVSDFIPKSHIQDPQNVDLWLKVGDSVRQSGNTKDMIFKLPYIISYISNIVTLEHGDIILTGTPSGVGPVTAGEVIECGLKGVKEMKFSVEK